LFSAMVEVNARRNPEEIEERQRKKKGRRPIH
jgi:hypothetical protein